MSFVQSLAPLTYILDDLTGSYFKPLPDRVWWSSPAGQWQLLTQTASSLLPASTQSLSNSMISGWIWSFCWYINILVGQVLWQGSLFFLQTSSWQPRNWVDWTQVLSWWQGDYYVWLGTSVEHSLKAEIKKSIRLSFYLAFSSSPSSSLQTSPWSSW